MTTPETKVKRAVVKILDKHGAYHFFPATHGYGRSGVPDIVVCYNSQFIGIECKAGKGKTTALQEKNIAQIIATGGKAIVVNEENIDHVRYLLGEM